MQPPPKMNASLIENQNYKDLLFQAPTPIAILKGRELTFIFANPPYTALYGREVVNKTVLEALPELKGQPAYSMLEDVLATGIPFHGHEHPVEADFGGDGKKTTRYFNFIYTPYKNEAGTIEGIMAFGFDVTAQVEARKKVEEVRDDLDYRNALFLAQNEATPDGILIVNAKGEIVSYNRRFAEIWNLPQEIADSRSDQAALQHAMQQLTDPDGFLERVQYLYTHQRERSNEEIYFRDGRVINRHGAPVIGRDGTYYAWAWYFRDITDEKRNKEAVDYQNMLIRTITDNATSCLFMMDRNGYCTFMNAAAEKTFGYTQDEIRQKPLHYLIHHHRPDGSLYPKEECPLDRALPENFDVRAHRDLFFRKDGTTLPVTCAASPIFEDGTPVSTVIEVRDITRELEAEQLLKKSAEELERKVQERTRELEKVKLDQQTYNLFMQAPVAICILKGPDQVIQLANQPILDIWRKDRSVIGKPILEALPEIRGSAFPDLLQQVRASGIPHHASESHAYFLRNGKEELVYFNFVYQPYYEEGETQPIGVMAIANEVTEQVLARKKVEESEKRFRNLVEEAPVATAVLTGPGLTVALVNDAMLQTWGKDASITGKNFREALPEMEGQPFQNLLQQVYATGETYSTTEGKAEFVIDGRRRSFYFNFTYKALRNTAGEVYAVLIMAVDVTDQVLARQQLEQSEARVRLAVATARLGTYEIDLGQQTILYSARTAEIFGLDPGRQWAYERFKEAVVPEDRPVRLQAHEKALLTGALFYEVRILLPDGTLRWVRLNGKVLYEEQSPRNLIGTVLDITEEKRASELLEEKIRERTQALQEANEQLERSNNELEQFAHISSHDLQEPLRKIIMFTEMVRERSAAGLDETARRNLAKVSDAATRMSASLKALLEYTQLQKEEQLSAVDLNGIVAGVLSDLELVVGQKGARVQVEHLPVIRGIPHQLQQLFYNLVNNALKFTRPGVSPEVRITARHLPPAGLPQGLDPARPYVEIVVQDNGIGFEPAQAQKIFTIFQRLHDRSTYSGTGIGLALCRKVVQKHKGEIWAEARPGQGAAFHLVLPEQ